MVWKKSPPRMVELLEAVAPGPPAMPRQMFGYPSYFVNGNLFMGLFQDQLFLRLSEADKAELSGRGAEPLEPMKGRPMRAYLIMPVEVLEDEDELRSWAERSLAHARTLPVKGAAAKTASKPKATKTTKATKARR